MRPAGFEPATRCLEGTCDASRHVAWHRSAGHLAGRIVWAIALCRSVSAIDGSRNGSLRPTAEGRSRCAATAESPAKRLPPGYVLVGCRAVSGRSMECGVPVKRRRWRP